jgi:hypothetical protein
MMCSRKQNQPAVAIATAKAQPIPSTCPERCLCLAGHRPMLISSLDGSEGMEADIGVLGSITWLLLRLRLTLENVKAQRNNPCSRLDLHPSVVHLSA